MSGEVIELTGARAPKKPTGKVYNAIAAEGMIEPALAPTFVCNAPPCVVVLGGIATVYLSSLEMPLYGEADGPHKVIQAKLAIPEGLLQEFAIALAQAAGARLVDETEGGDQ